MKRCTKCGIEKENSEFGKHKYSKDGLTSRCKDCRNIDQRTYNQTERGKEYNRKYKISDKCTENRKEYRKNDKTKYMAHIKLNSAVQRGKITKPSECSICGKSAIIHGHHEDYTKPYDVIWLCSKCHTYIHFYIENDGNVEYFFKTYI